MSIDKLQEKIRKLKNPIVLNLDLLPEWIPTSILEATGDLLSAYQVYTKQLLEGLKERIPAVRFDFGSFALYGGTGFAVLCEMLSYAAAAGYYVLLDGVDSLSPHNAEHNAQQLFSLNNGLYFDGLVTTSYIGSDAIKPYAQQAKTADKALFVAVRTANRTASETQDLITGSRLAYEAKTDIVNRYAPDHLGRCGYSHLAVMAAASSADCLRKLRSKYKSLFLLVDGCDYPNGNAKNCSLAFDTLGHGAAVCVGESIMGAWREGDGQDYVTCAVGAADRLKRNLSRYVTIL